MVVISCKLQFFLKLHLIAFKNSLSSPTFKVKNLAFIDFHQILQQKCIKKNQSWIFKNHYSNENVCQIQLKLAVFQHSLKFCSKYRWLVPLQAFSLIDLTMLFAVLKCDANTCLLVVAICRSCVTLKLWPRPTAINVTPARRNIRAGAMTESSDLPLEITMATFGLVVRAKSVAAAYFNAFPAIGAPPMYGTRPNTFTNVAWFVKRLKSNNFLGLVLNSTIPKRVIEADTENDDTICFKKLRM